MIELKTDWGLLKYEATPLETMADELAEVMGISLDYSTFDNHGQLCVDKSSDDDHFTYYRANEYNLSKNHEEIMPGSPSAEGIFVKNGDTSIHLLYRIREKNKKAELYTHLPGETNPTEVQGIEGNLQVAIYEALQLLDQKKLAKKYKPKSE